VGDQRLVVRRAPKKVLVGLEISRHVQGLDGCIRVAKDAPSHFVLQLVQRLAGVLRVVSHEAVEGRISAGQLGGL
jgi:hypothetical protein